MTSLSFDIFWRDHGANRGMNELGQSATRTQQRMHALKAAAVAGAAMAGAALLEMGKKSVEVASNIAESQSKVSVVFGKSAQSVLAFSATSASSLGISKDAALEAAGTFGNLFVSMKLPQGEAAKMSTKMITLAADMASFNNASPEEALDAIRSGLVGETEPLRKFGVNMNDATLRTQAMSMGLIKNTKQALSPAVKAQAAYGLMLAQTGTAQGDFARTSSGMANQQRILKARFSDLQGQLGAKLLPVVNRGLKMFLDFSGVISRNAKIIVPLVSTLVAFGGAIWVVNKAAKAYEATQLALNVVMAMNPIGLVVIALIALGAGLVLAYKKSDTFRAIVDATFKSVSAAAKFMWERVLRPTFRFLINSWLTVAGAIVHGAEKAFGWVPGVGPKLKKAAREFDQFKDAINRSLNGIRDEKVIVRLNTQASVYGTKGGHYVGSTFVKFARGGPVWGAGTETSDDIPAMLSRNEHVWSAREVRGAGGHGEMERMRKQARGFALGGAATGRSIAGKIDHGVHAMALLGEARIQSYFKVMNAGLGGALAFARAQVGKPYIWGAVGPRGYDCSGFMSALLNVVQHRNPYQRRFSTGTFPTAGFVSGPGNFMIGSRRGNPGHMAGTINGVNVESSGSIGPHMGPSARGARNGMFTGLYHLRGYAKGGPVGDAPFDLLDPAGSEYLGDKLRRQLLFGSGGVASKPSLIGVAEHGPERVLSATQTRSFDRLTRVLDRRPALAGQASDAAGIDYARLGDQVASAFIRAGVTVRMDGRAVGAVMGSAANLLGRAG